MHQYWKAAKQSVGFATDDPPPLREQSYLEELGEMSSLTAWQRLIGFFLSMAMGITFVAIALSFVPIIALFPMKFAFFFTCGNFFCVASTAFLMGPRQQLATMLEAHRAQTAAAFVGSTIMTLFSALQLRSSALALFFSCLQLVSVLSYGLSFIPFARQVVGTVMSYAAVVAKPALQVVWSVASKLLGYCCRR